MINGKNSYDSQKNENEHKIFTDGSSRRAFVSGKGRRYFFAADRALEITILQRVRKIIWLILKMAMRTVDVHKVIRALFHPTM